MTRNKYTYFFIGALPAAVILTLLTGYLLFFTGEYAGAFRKDMIKSTENILSFRENEEYAALLSDIKKEYTETERYHTALRSDREGRYLGISKEEKAELLRSRTMTESEAANRL